MFAEECENAGATIFTDVGEEYCVFGIRMRAPSASSLLPLFAEMMNRPRLADEEFVRLQREMIISLKAEAVNPHSLAIRHFYAELAGEKHPAGRLETVRSLKKITLRDVRSCLDDLFSAERSAFSPAMVKGPR
jgi:predicted Zn-dependent peptidase